MSHGHSDHTVATVEALEMTNGCKVYAHPQCFMPRYYQSKSGKRTKEGVPEGQGVPEIESAGGELILSHDPVEVVPGLWTTGQIPRVTDFEHIPKPREGRKRVIIVDGEEQDDQILCDQSLWMEIEDSGCWVITGCAHSGAVNTLKRVSELGGFNEIYAYIGGTHLVGREDSYIMRTANELKKFNLQAIQPMPLHRVQRNVHATQRVQGELRRKLLWQSLQLMGETLPHGPVTTTDVLSSLLTMIYSS